MSNIRRIASSDGSSIPGLCRLLIDAVTGGASVGFIAPMSYETALSYWQQVLSNLNNGIALWVAEVDGVIVGSVQLDLCGKENGRHRAEIQKLFVIRTHRGRGISSALMQTAETFAYTDGRTLLVLDTQAGSFAESVYQHLGWQKVGEIPYYAASPNGELLATSFFFKRIDR